MSVIKPEIDSLLNKCDHNPYLLCSIASQRACDVNNMIRGQHLRVTALQEFDDITNVISGKDTVSIAMSEISNGILSYEKESFDEALKAANQIVD